MNLNSLIIVAIILYIILVLITLLIIPASKKCEKVPAQTQLVPPRDRSRFNQTKYQHNVTKSSGRGHIINEEGECKLWSAENRIVGGMEAEIGESPYIALLEYAVDSNSFRFDCVGALINQRYVITAAQCLYEKNLVNVRLGVHDLSKTIVYDDEGVRLPDPINVGIEEITIHPNYSSSHWTNDIGLIRLSTDVKYEVYFVQPICIPDTTMNTEVGAVGKVGSWGSDDQGIKKTALQSVWVKIVDWQKCRDTFRQFYSIQISQLCAGGEREKNACPDDLGAPMLMRHNRRSYLKGIVSRSSGCRGNGLPDVYTKVNYFYDWIVNNLKP